MFPAPNSSKFVETTSVKGQVEHELRHLDGAIQAEHLPHPRDAYGEVALGSDKSQK